MNAQKEKKMKSTIKYLLGAMLAVPLLCGCREETPDTNENIAETIVVSGAEGYRIQTFTEGARIITDRAYKVTNIPDYFNGFEMLTSKARANNGGTITAKMDGLVYIVAPASAKPEGWSAVPNTIYQDRDMKYATADQEVKLSVYMKRAYAGKPVEIPQVTTFASAVPIARKIVYDVPEEPLSTSTVRGTVKCGGQPVKDVVVSDGELTTLTDEEGNYVLHSWKRTGYVFISVPGGYEVAADGLIPRNFVRLDGADDEVADFELTKTENDEFTLFVMNDIHLTNTTETDDVQRFRRDFAPDYSAMLAQTPGKVYATVLGDMTTDTRWYRNNFALPEYLAEMERVPGAIPIWHVMGNHDNDIRCSGPSEVWDMLAVETYRRVLGPNYYSINLGEGHFVVLDAIVYTGANAYNTYVEEVQLGWLEKDLSHVDAATPVAVLTHAPLYRYSGMADGVLLANKGFSNPDQVDWLLEKFAKFERVHIMSAHTHMNYCCKISDRITEHNNISVSGSSWQIPEAERAQLSKDGTPVGYTIYRFEGKKMTRQYKATGRDADECQFMVYDLNTVPEAYGGAAGSNQLLLNVYNWDPEWTVKARENGVEIPVVQSWRADPLYSLAAEGLTGLSSAFAPGAGVSHMFVATASAADTTVEVEVTDGAGNSWTQTAVRPKAFTWDMR